MGALAFSLALSGTGVAAPQRAQRAPVIPSSRYLALGDSVTFGYQEPTVVPKPNYKDAASFFGYPEQLGPQLKLKVTNAACPGETSSSLINVNAVSNGCENILGKPAGYRRLFPLHARYRGPQLAFAVAFLRSHPDVRLVSLMIGANDLLVCQETTKDGCTSRSEQQPVLAMIRRNVHRIVSALRRKAHYRGQLVILNYYSTDYSNATISGYSRLLNQAQDSGAAPFGVTIADGYGTFRKAAKRSGGNPCTAGLLTQLGTPTKCGVHPSYAGQALLAQAIARAVRL